MTTMPSTLAHDIVEPAGKGDIGDLLPDPGDPEDGNAVIWRFVVEGDGDGSCLTILDDHPGTIVICIWLHLQYGNPAPPFPNKVQEVGIISVFFPDQRRFK